MPMPRMHEMRHIKKNKCSVLPLVLKGKWYDMIESGEKTEEYREYKPFWESRIRNWNTLDKIRVVAFSRGYKKASMFYTVASVLIAKAADDSNHPEWGEPKTLHFVIQLGKRVELVE